MKLHEVYRRADLALRLGAHTYTSQLCEFLLRYFPGDPHVRTLLGLVSLEEGQLDRARQQLDLTLEYDPEDAVALSALGVVHTTEGRLGAAVKAFERAFDLNPGNNEVRDSLLRLYAQRDGGSPELPAAPAVAMARWRLRRGNVGTIDAALDEANALLVRQPGQVCLLLAKAEALWRHRRYDDAERTCRQLLTRHPRLLKPRIILGQILAADPLRDVEGVELLHQGFADDPDGRIIRALGSSGDLVVPDYSDEIDLPLPAELVPLPATIASAIELAPTDALPGAGATWEPPLSTPVVLKPEPALVEPEEPEENPEAPPAAEAPAADSTADHLIVVSTRAGITARFGPEGYDRVDRRLQSCRRELAELGMSLTAAILDDPLSLSAFEAAPAQSTDPRELKRVIDQVIGNISSANPSDDLRIALLILGGDEIVPFFRVPNPADDDDVVVVTDTPYGASPGGSVFHPDLPVGRLPDAAGGNLTALLRKLDQLVEARRRPRLSMNGPGLLRAGLSALGSFGRNLAAGPAFASGVADWGPVLSEVIGGLAASATIRLSPPVTADDFNIRWLSDRRFLHFALNGDATAMAWYGQPVESDEGETAVLPATLESEQISGVDLGGPVVFCDASYALSLAGRGAGPSLALRFLAEGAAAVIGPTAATYGSPQLPLDGSDLLAYLFWSELRKGATTGEALLIAKHRYIEHAVERQGYLDGDDQKLLLQYVLYGDPTQAICEEQGDADDEDLSLDRPDLPVLCNRVAANGSAPLAPRQLRNAMEQIVTHLPGVGAHGIRVQRRSGCAGDCDHPGHRAQSSRPAPPEVTTISARLEIPTSTGGQVVKVARVTLAADGAVQKILVSR